MLSVKKSHFTCVYFTSRALQNMFDDYWTLSGISFEDTEACNDINNVIPMHKVTEFQKCVS